MTTLAIAVDADDELWTLDDLPTPEAPYVEVESELIEVRSRFPSSYYTLTGETLPPRIRVRRGIAGTTKASHIQGSTLTPNYGLGGVAGGGAIAVTDGSTTVADATSIEVSGAIVTDAGGGIAHVDVPVQQGIEIEATGATAAEINLTASTEDGNAAILGEAYSENSQGSINLAAGGGNEEASLDLAASDGGGSLATLNATNIGFYGNAATPRIAIADATDPASTMARLNDLLAFLRLRGDLAP